MKNWFLFVRALLYPLVKILFPFKVMDKHKYKKYERGQILVSNHLSWMDVPYMYYGTPGFKRLLSKKENAGGKIRRSFLQSIGIIFVNRDKPELSSMRECLSALKDGQTLSIFPEGTRNRVNRDIQQMHSGAAMFALKGNATVLPLVVHHKGKLFKRNYVGIGDPIALDDLFGRRMDQATLDEATARFRDGMEKTLSKLDRWVEEKGYKTEKKTLRREKRELKIKYKQAKREYAQSRNGK